MSYELRHHGILGQKWGKRNGPPYPLGAASHSPREKKAGWQKSLRNHGVHNKPTHSANRSDGKRRNEKSIWEHHKLTDKQKKAIKVGAMAAGAALLTIGMIKYSRSGTIQALATIGQNDLKQIIGDGGAGVMKTIVPIDANAARLPRNETIEEAIKHANPYRVTHYGKHIVNDNLKFLFIFKVKRA